MKKILFAETSEITDTNFLIKKIDGMSVGAIKLNDEYKLVLNVCPHAHAEICRGKISNLFLEYIAHKTKTIFCESFDYSSLLLFSETILFAFFKLVHFIVTVNLQN